jgi:hypothetical protein
MSTYIIKRMYLKNHEWQVYLNGGRGTLIHQMIVLLLFSSTYKHHRGSQFRLEKCPNTTLSIAKVRQYLFGDHYQFFCEQYISVTTKENWNLAKSRNFGQFFITACHSSDISLLSLIFYHWCIHGDEISRNDFATALGLLLNADGLQGFILFL